MNEWSLSIKSKESESSNHYGLSDREECIGWAYVVRRVHVNGVRCANSLLVVIGTRSPAWDCVRIEEWCHINVLSLHEHAVAIINIFWLPGFSARTEGAEDHVTILGNTYGREPLSKSVFNTLSNIGSNKLAFTTISLSARLSLRFQFIIENTRWKSIIMVRIWEFAASEANIEFRVSRFIFLLIGWKVVWIISVLCVTCVHKDTVECNSNNLFHVLSTSSFLGVSILSGNEWIFRPCWITHLIVNFSVSSEHGVSSTLVGRVLIVLIEGIGFGVPGNGEIDLLSLGRIGICIVTMIR